MAHRCVTAVPQASSPRFEGFLRDVQCLGLKAAELSCSGPRLVETVKKTKRHGNGNCRCAILLCSGRGLSSFCTRRCSSPWAACDSRSGLDCARPHGQHTAICASCVNLELERKNSGTSPIDSRHMLVETTRCQGINCSATAVSACQKLAFATEHGTPAENPYGAGKGLHG